MDLFKWIIIGVGAAIALCIIAMIVAAVVTSKKKKSEDAAAAQGKNATLQAIEAQKQQSAEKIKANAAAEQQRQAAIRKEVFAKLAAQEGAKEDPPVAKKAVAEEKPVAKKAAVKKEVAVAEEKPVAKKAPAKKTVAEEKPVAKKAPAKKEVVEEKKAPVKKAATKKAEPLPVLTDDSDTDTLARYAGKWEIYHIITDDMSEEDTYFFELRASNGEKLLSSEEYTSYQGAVRGIETHKQNILKGNFKITLSKKGDYIVKLLSGSGQLLCTGENYANKARCESAIKSIKRFARTAIVDDNVQDFLLKMPKEEEGAVETFVATDGVQGKWIISSRADLNDEKVFFFELFANNGEKLLSSEEYTTYAGAVNGLQTHKQNIAKGNFRITLTKKGDYIYKLLNGNGQLLCLGEHYKSKTRCQSAVESVKRFSENSPVFTDSEQA